MLNRELLEPSATAIALKLSSRHPTYWSKRLSRNPPSTAMAICRPVTTATVRVHGMCVVVLNIANSAISITPRRHDNEVNDIIDLWSYETDVATKYLSTKLHAISQQGLPPCTLARIGYATHTHVMLAQKSHLIEYKVEAWTIHLSQETISQSWSFSVAYH